MKKAFLFLILAGAVCYLSNCKSKSQSNSQDSISQQKDSISTKESVVTTTRKDTSGHTEAVKDSTNTRFAEATLLPGTWQAKDSNSPDFEIRKSTIKYFNHPAVVPYKIVGDSIKIYYEKDFSMSFALRLSGKDTLIMTGDKESVFYRVK